MTDQTESDLLAATQAWVAAHKHLYAHTITRPAYGDPIPSTWIGEELRRLEDCEVKRAYLLDTALRAWAEARGVSFDVRA